ncbi:hypothetical protein IA525_03790 [Listeria seeligeri]|uniref:hypothetical protein n=1 Tax=Listeria seeligeri TaxID=1640 RepID=UPI0018898B37|nr:hypothetical protein [Listeria seeligeri]MBF2389853.1 hypothetical protein [Listeria seeligeri]
MTHIISAFPGLGKTTIFQLNKERTFDREFNESRSVKGMSLLDAQTFFDQCANIVKLQLNSNVYDYIFITDHRSIVLRLYQTSITHIYPNVFDEKIMEDYKKRIIQRNDLKWYERVIEPRLVDIQDYIEKLIQMGCDVRFTDIEHPYIEDVFSFEDFILLPKKKGRKENVSSKYIE